MTLATRDTVLFWCQVSLYVSAIVTLLGILAIFWFVLTSQMHAMEENRARDKAMLQQHMSVLQDHDRAREQHAKEFERTLQHHDETMQRLRQP